jgi:molecular chaperone GrpE (heat shock protein)
MKYKMKYLRQKGFGNKKIEGLMSVTDKEREIDNMLKSDRLNDEADLKFYNFIKNNTEDIKLFINKIYNEIIIKYMPIYDDMRRAIAIARKKNK